MSNDKIEVQPWQRVVSYTLAMIAIYLSAFFLIPFAISSINYTTGAPRIRSINNFRQITLGLRTYAVDHKGAIPNTLSQLIPEYLTELELFYIKPHSSQKFHPPYPADASDRLRLLDTLSPYHFTHYPKARLIVVHETPGIWKGGKMAYSFLEQDENDAWQGGGVVRRTPQEFEAALKSKLKTRTPSNKSE